MDEHASESLRFEAVELPRDFFPLHIAVPHVKGSGPEGRGRIGEPFPDFLKVPGLVFQIRLRGREEERGKTEDQK
jgi:hypothetical protein